MTTSMRACTRATPTLILVQGAAQADDLEKPGMVSGISPLPAGMVISWYGTARCIATAEDAVWGIDARWGQHELTACVYALVLVCTLTLCTNTSMYTSMH